MRPSKFMIEFNALFKDSSETSSPGIFASPNCSRQVVRDDENGEFSWCLSSFWLVGLTMGAAGSISSQMSITWIAALVVVVVVVVLVVHGACRGTLGLMECQKYVLYVIRKSLHWVPKKRISKKNWLKCKGALPNGVLRMLVGNRVNEGFNPEYHKAPAPFLIPS